MKSKTTFIFLFLLASTLVLAQTGAVTETTPQSVTKVITKNGIGFGAVLAIVLSWDRNKSILWAMLHGLFSWLYVIYYAITRK